MRKKSNSIGGSRAPCLVPREASPACCSTGRLRFEVEASAVQKWPQTCQISWEQLPTRWHQVRVCHFLWSSRFSSWWCWNWEQYPSLAAPLHTFHTSSSSSPLFSLGSSLRKCSSYFDTKVKKQTRGRKKTTFFSLSLFPGCDIHCTFAANKHNAHFCC